MTGPGAAGVVLYAAGLLDRIPDGWQGHSTAGPQGTGHHDLAIGTAEVVDDDYATVTNTLTGEAAGIGDLARVDIVWWLSGPPPSSQAVVELVTANTAHLELPEPVDQPPPWPIDTNWPAGWHPWSGTDRGGMTCTIEARALSRIWLVAATSPYAGTSPSISDLLVTDGATGLRGALPEHVATLAEARQHLITSVGTDRYLLDLAPGVIPPPETALAVSDVAIRQTSAHQSLVTTRFNLDRTRDQLVARIDKLAGGSEAPATPSGRTWPFATTDRRQVDEAVATTELNATRATGVQHHVDAVRQQHASEGTTRATRDNTFATLALTVIAGGLGAIQLADSNEHRVGLVLAIGGALLGVGVVGVDARTPYTRAHHLVVAAAFAASGVGLAVRFTDHAAVAVAGAVIGAATGRGLCQIVDWAALSPTAERLRSWLGASGRAA